MSATMKGLLKGLRHIFDTKQEHEMQIGFPTDVKHVAHIGWDSASVNSPSWMNVFRAAESAADQGLPGLSPPAAVNARRIPRRRKQKVNAAASAIDSPNREPSSRRRASKTASTADSSRQEPPLSAPENARRKKGAAKSKFWATPPNGGEDARTN